jgi:hypothetical protein
MSPSPLSIPLPLPLLLLSPLLHVPLCPFVSFPMSVPLCLFPFSPSMYLPSFSYLCLVPLSRPSVSSRKRKKTPAPTFEHLFLKIPELKSSFACR